MHRPCQLLERTVMGVLLDLDIDVEAEFSERSKHFRQCRQRLTAE